MRLLQLHEYLALLGGDNETVSLSPGDPRRASWLREAEALWPELAMKPWGERPRHVELVTRCGGGELLVHVGADEKDCFLILVAPPEGGACTGHILFDIGAEYREITFSCPTFDVEAPVEREMIRDLVPLLGREPNPFAILSKSARTYMQVYADGARYSVEHQLVSAASHYELVEPVSVEAAVELLTDYAYGKYEWARSRRWRRLAL